MASHGLLFRAHRETHVLIGRQLDSLPAQYITKNKRSYDGRVRFDRVSRRVHCNFAPTDLFIWFGSTVRAVACRAVRYLTKVTPNRSLTPTKVFVEEWDYADRKVSRNATADLEEANPPRLRAFLIPVNKLDHVVDPALNPHFV